MNEKICFVLMGYGIKTDLATGRQLDLDKTYEYLIKPVFDDLAITCIRASDIRHSGIIDMPMYENILKADIVVADISTLNPNAIYELGVRHALKPHTTIVIAESELQYPFDLQHILITKYEHLGKDIGISEAKRFLREFRNLVEQVLKDPQIDSPVYTYIKGLNPPQFTPAERAELKEAAEEGDTITHLLKEAEELKSKKDFEGAINRLNQARTLAPGETFIIQRLALITYKSKLPDTVASLYEAKALLGPLHPETTNDPETLGLMGAIYKRLHEELKNSFFLQKSIGFYERGFLISRDYYNGINLAYLYLLSASLASSPEDQIADYVMARRIRAKTKDICLMLVQKANFAELNDKVWILLTLAEIEGLEGNVGEAERYFREAEAAGADDFATGSYQEQQQKINIILTGMDLLPNTSANPE